MVLLPLIISLITFLFFILLKCRKGRILLPPPGPPGLPFLGNLHQIDSSAPHRCLWQLSKKYGPLMSLRFGLVPTLVVSSARMAKEVVKTHDLTFCSRYNLVGQQKLSYGGLDLAFSPYNEYWKQIRKICLHNLFSSKRVQSFRPIREDEVCQMIEKISELASSSKLVNLSEIMRSLSSTIICRVAFGKSYNKEGYEKNRFIGLLAEFQAMVGTLFISDLFPLFGWVDRLTGLHFRLEKFFEKMDTFYQELIEEHLDPKRQISMQEDIIDVLLQLKEDQLSSINITFDHIKAVLMDILTGGTDAIAMALVWAMTGLMKNPRVMKKVQEEIRKLSEDKGKVDEDDLEKLAYLKAVVKETMRLHPPIPLIPRETLQKCIIDGYEIQPKTLVFINAWAIGRDTESWENPEEFSPERFLGSAIDHFKEKDYELIPFGGGKRGCPGKYYGSVTVELALANLLYSFDWELPKGMKKEDIDTDVVPGVTMHKKNDLCLLAIRHI